MKRGTKGDRQGQMSILSMLWKMGTDRDKWGQMSPGQDEEGGGQTGTDGLPPFYSRGCPCPLCPPQRCAAFVPCIYVEKNKKQI